MSELREFRQTLALPADHPCLPGHFPGLPVVPAVVLLDQVERALGVALGATVRLRALPAVKFSSPLAPDMPYEIVLSIDEAARSARFRIVSRGVDTVQGRLEYEAAPA
jgi:3-hydroxymyristoyl/3-hydroxydecanoyl-(acyl carrier protein) dehydratase